MPIAMPCSLPRNWRLRFRRSMSSSAEFSAMAHTQHGRKFSGGWRSCGPSCSWAEVRAHGGWRSDVDSPSPALALCRRRKQTESERRSPGQFTVRDNPRCDDRAQKLWRLGWPTGRSCKVHSQSWGRSSEGVAGSAHDRRGGHAGREPGLRRGAAQARAEGVGESAGGFGG